MKLVETTAKSIITKSKLPDAYYVVNPYIGCSFSCGYCYASFMGRFVGEPIEAWGSFVYVKTNAVGLFKEELARFDATQRKRSMLLSSVTDAWQGPEKKYRLSRGILEILARERYPGEVAVLTKSPLVLRDLDVLKSLRNPDVGVTITTTDDAVGRVFEAHAPSASTRLDILKAFNQAEVPTYAFVGPLFPHFMFAPKKLEDLLKQIFDAGTRDVYVEQINLSGYIRKRLDEVMLKAEPGLAKAYASADEKEHRRVLQEMVEDMVSRIGLRLRMSQVLDHRRDCKRRSPTTNAP